MTQPQPTGPTPKTCSNTLDEKLLLVFIKIRAKLLQKFMLKYFSLISNLVLLKIEEKIPHFKLSEKKKSNCKKLCLERKSYLCTLYFIYINIYFCEELIELNLTENTDPQNSFVVS